MATTWGSSGSTATRRRYVGVTMRCQFLCARVRVRTLFLCECYRLHFFIFVFLQSLVWPAFALQKVYDHNVRVPMLWKGPGIIKGAELPIVSSMADIAPTLLELIGATDAESVAMDGTSFAQQLLEPSRSLLLGETGSQQGGEARRRRQRVSAAEGFGRTATLIEYVESGGRPRCSNAMDPPAPQNISCHWHDGPNNTFSALRIISPKLGDLMYVWLRMIDDELSATIITTLAATPPQTALLEQDGRLSRLSDLGFKNPLTYMRMYVCALVLTCAHS